MTANGSRGDSTPNDDATPERKLAIAVFRATEAGSNQSRDDPATVADLVAQCISQTHGQPRRPTTSVDHHQEHYGGRCGRRSVPRRDKRTTAR